MDIFSPLTSHQGAQNTAAPISRDTRNACSSRPPPSPPFFPVSPPTPLPQDRQIDLSSSGRPPPMGSANSAALADLSLAVTAVLIFPILEELELQSRLSTPTTDQISTALDRVARELLLLAAALALFAAMALMYLQLHYAAAAVDGRKNRLSERVTFALCGAVGVLQFLFFLLPDDASLDFVVDALGGTAVDELPAAAAVVFFLGMVLLLIAHIRAGGEGGGTGSVAESRSVRVPVGVVRVLEKVAVAAAGALLCEIVVAVLYAAM